MTGKALDLDGYCRYAVREQKSRFLLAHWKCRHPDRNKTWRFPPRPGMNCSGCDRCMYDCIIAADGEPCPARKPPVRKTKNRLDSPPTHRKGLFKKILQKILRGLFTRKKGD